MDETSPIQHTDPNPASLVQRPSFTLPANPVAPIIRSSRSGIEQIVGNWVTGINRKKRMKAIQAVLDTRRMANDFQAQCDEAMQNNNIDLARFYRQEALSTWKSVDDMLKALGRKRV